MLWATTLVSGSASGESASNESAPDQLDMAAFESPPQLATPSKPYKNMGVKDKSLQLYFLTTRYNEGSQKAPRFSTSRHLDVGAGSVEYGSATLTKPPQLPHPATARNGSEYREALRLGSDLWLTAPVTKLTCFSDEQFFQKIRTWPNKICLYIHGYEKPFNRSLQDAAMLFADYQHFENTEENRLLPIVFAWPSAEAKTKYSVDEANIEWSQPAFESFMNRLLKEKNPSASIDIVTHSMGARLALSYLTKDHADLAKPWLRNLYMCSADVDFHSTAALAKTLDEVVSNSIYVFVSDRDMPLVISQYLHGQPRLGRPIDPPRGNDEQARTKANEVAGDFFKQLGSDAADLITGQGTTNTPEVLAWLKKNPNLDREFSERTRLLDVTNLVSANMGHGLPWSVLAGMIANQAKFPQLRVFPVHKKPDRTSLMESYGSPRVLYRFTRLEPN